MIEILDLNSVVYLSKSIYNILQYVSMHHFFCIFNTSLLPGVCFKINQPSSWTNVLTSWAKWLQSRWCNYNSTLNHLDWICFNSNQKTRQHSWTSKWRLSLNMSSFIDFNSNKIKNGTLPGTVTYPTKTGRSEQTVIVPKLFLWNKHTPNAPWCHNLPPWLLHFFR